MRGCVSIPWAPTRALAERRSCRASASPPAWRSYMPRRASATSGAATSTSSGARATWPLASGPDRGGTLCRDAELQAQARAAERGVRGRGGRGRAERDPGRPEGRGGQRLEQHADRRKWRLFAIQAGNHTTYVVIKSRRRDWKLTDDEAVPITRIGRRSGCRNRRCADVSGRGYRRTLSWRLRRIDGSGCGSARSGAAFTASSPRHARRAGMSGSGRPTAVRASAGSSLSSNRTASRARRSPLARTAHPQRRGPPAPSACGSPGAARGSA